MSQRHERKRPGGRTPVQLYAQPEGISVARLEPETDETPQPSTRIAAVPALTPEPPAPAAVPAPAAPTSATPVPQPAEVPATQPAPVTPVRSDPALKVTTTLQVQLTLKKQAETAVKTTGHLEGSYKSWAQLVNGAVANELARLADQFNDGQPFPENAGEFRNGRPLGS